MKSTVVLGLLGVTKDRAPRGENRWDTWRPSISIAQQDDLEIDRFELIRQEQFQPLADRVERDILTVSPETAINQHNIAFRDPWDFESVYADLHQFATAYPFDCDNEEYLVHITTGTHVAQICLFLLTESRHFPAKLLQTSPPRKRKTEVGSCTIIDLDLSKYDDLSARFREESDHARTLLKSGIETLNESFNDQVEQIEHVAVSSKAPILLMGPTGAGKSQLAKKIFELKRQRHQTDGVFVEVNCETLRGDGAASTLFGHKRGAFTGALQDRPGLLKRADNGLLFLDEIGELGLDEQAMLLGALEEKRFLPMGSDTETKSDFQLIAGTNRDLHTDVSHGLFREDLLSRIDLWTFHLPGLADRREDIEPNIRHELDRFAMAHKRRVRFNREAQTLYLKFATSSAAPWPGNFRDLNASMTRMATLARNGRIGVAHVQEEIKRLETAWGRKSGLSQEQGPMGALVAVVGEEFISRHDPFDLVQLAEVIQVCQKSPTLSHAGRELFCVSRTRRKTANDADRLRKYLAKFDLRWQDVRSQ